VALGEPVTRRAAVLGRPIAHSLSPVLHRAAYAALGLDWRYDAIEVDESGLAGFLRGCGPEWAGLSLTMPLKRAVLPLLDRASELVGLVGAANTVVFGADGTTGHNTDVAGIAAALTGMDAPAGPALVLGGGATAASSLAALARVGCREVHVRARRPDLAHGQLATLAGALGLALDVAAWPTTRLPERGTTPVVVCTTPPQASRGLVGLLPRSPGWLLDVSYAPWPPELVRAWRAAGGVAVAGDEMLLHQAAGQVALMTGRTPDLGAMRAALRARLGAGTT